MRFLIFLAAVAFPSLAAVAGDLPSKDTWRSGVIEAPAEAGRPYNWTGPYIGAHGGYGFLNRELNFSQVQTIKGDEGEEEFESGARLKGLGGEGWIGGGHVGFDMQVGRTVGRTRLDYSVSDIETAARIFSGDEAASAAFVKQDEWIGWAGVGIPIDDAGRTLLYGLIGYGETTYKLDCRACGEIDGAEKDYQGIAGAIGLEHAWSRDVSISFEAQYLKWDTETIAAFDEPGVSAKLTDDTSEFRALMHLNWKLHLADDLNPLK